MIVLFKRRLNISVIYISRPKSGQHLIVQSSNRHTWIISKIYSKLTIETAEWRQWRRFGVFIINFELFWCFNIIDFEEEIKIKYRAVKNSQPSYCEPSLR